MIDFGSILGPSGPLCEGLLASFLVFVVLFDFCWNFVGIEVPARGARGAGTLRWKCHPPPAFSDIRGQKQRFRLRVVAFSEFLGCLLP